MRTVFSVFSLMLLPVAAVAGDRPVGYGISPEISEIVGAAGVLGVVVLLIAAIMLFLIVEITYSIRVTSLVPDAVVDDVEAALDEGEYERALEASRSVDCLVGYTLSAALEKVGYTFERMQQVMNDELESEVMIWRQRVDRLKLIARLTPWIGLLGVARCSVPVATELIHRIDSMSTDVRVVTFSHDFRVNVNAMIGFVLVCGAITVLSTLAHDILRTKLDRVVMGLRLLAEETLDRFRPLPEDIE